jgi:hypothetical protein
VTLPWPKEKKKNIYNTKLDGKTAASFGAAAVTDYLLVGQ